MPAYASGLDQVESWFELITQRTVCCGSFDFVAEFKRKINNKYVEHYNQRDAVLSVVEARHVAP